MFFQVQCLGDNLNPAAQFRPKERHQSRAHTACGTRTGHVFNVDMQRLLNDVREMAKIFIQLNNFRFVGPFLRAKNICTRIL